MKLKMTEKEAEEQLKHGYAKARDLLNDDEKVEKFLQKLEHKMKLIPKIGDKLAYVPVMASLLRSYVKKEYTTVPVGTIVAITSALLYFVSPIDVIPDAIPGAGYIDDAAVALLCWNIVGDDVKKYEKWRKDNGMEFEVE